MPAQSNPLSDLLQPQVADSTTETLDSVKTVADEVTQLIASKELSSDTFAQFLSDWLTRLVDFGLRVVIAFVVYFLFRRLAKWVIGWFKRTMARRNADPGLISFLSSVFHGLALIIILIVLVDILGFKSVSFAALLAAMGVAIGAALSGQLQNLAAGVVILATKPFRVGDWVIAKDEEGEVSDISIFYTTITSIDQSAVRIPNSLLTSDKVINTSFRALRRCQWVVTIPYGGDVDLAKATMLSTVENDPRFKKDPPYLIVVRELADSGVKVMLRAYCDNDLYWNLYWENNERIYKAFQEKQIPFALHAVKLYQGGDEQGMKSQSATHTEQTTKGTEQ